MRTQYLALLFTVFLLSLPFSAAASDRIEFVFDADIPGAEVETLYWTGKRYKVGKSCVVPCNMTLKTNKIGPFLFHHEGHGTVGALAPTKTWSAGIDGETIRIEADFLTVPTPQGYGSELGHALAGEDRPAKAIFRIPSPMPPRARRSGWCVVGFDIDETGRTQNVSSTDCSEPLFENYAEAAIEVWRYIPAIDNGKTVATIGETFTLEYRLDDGKGGFVPSKKQLPADD